jgi:hypothetical protein
VANEVPELKAEAAKNILVGGSGQLMKSLMQNRLIDEFRPLSRGIGRRKAPFRRGQFCTAQVRRGQAARLRSCAYLIRAGEAGRDIKARSYGSLTLLAGYR